jgi:hypothetical protein
MGHGKARSVTNKAVSELLLVSRGTGKLLAF